MFDAAELSLPIQRIAVKGPAVDRLAARQENNNNARAEVAKFSERYQKNKAANIAGLKRLAGRV